MSDYDYLVFIGRFQPWHAGHMSVARQALNLSDNLIIVLGGHNSARSARDPFTSLERIDIILSCFSPEDQKRIHFAFQPNYLYNDAKWITSIQSAVWSITNRTWRAGPVKIGLIGREKDGSSYYLKFFPTWGHVAVEQKLDIDATNVRKNFYKDVPLADNGNWIVNTKHAIIVSEAFLSEELKPVFEEYFFVEKYKKAWEGSPYPPVFFTCDAVVTQAGHILLVRRGAMPGKGLWALPGGFVNFDETSANAALRELREETGLKVPTPVLKGSVASSKLFDNPWRSQRGRTVTHAFHFKLSDNTELPKVKGGDDASEAFWVSLNEVMNNRVMMYEDHYDIIDYMVGLPS